MPKIKAVAFDVDGTLYPQWRLLTTSLFFYFTNYHLVKNYWQIRKDLRHQDCQYQTQGREGLLHYQAKKFSERTGQAIEEVKKQLDLKIYQQWERTFTKIKPLSGVKSVLKELRNRGYIIAAMSDFPVEKKLDYFNLGKEYWDLAITSESSGYLKPHTAAFQYLASQLGLKKHEILYVGNDYSHDILGGNRAGCFTAHFTKKTQEDSVADFDFSNYRQFLQKFDQFTL